MKISLQKVAMTAMLWAGLLHSGWVAALGLGEIEVSSHLNERLLAEIPLVNEGRLDKSQILVKLGSSKDFERAGIDRPFYLTSLKFQIKDAAKGKVLEITTPDVLREPFLNFIVEVRWPSGKMLKEFTVLLDLPISQSVDQSPATLVAADVSATDRDQLAVAVTSSSPLPSRTEPAPRKEQTPVKKSEGPVRTGSAADLLPKFTASSPARKPVSSPAKDTAGQAVATTKATPPAQEAKPAETTVSSAQGSGREQAAASGSAADSLPGVDVDAEVARLQTELARSLENLDKAALENKELEQRIAGVESQVDDFEKLVDLKTQELEAVQASINEKQEQLIAEGTVPAADPTAEVSDAAAEVKDDSAALVDSLAQSATPDVATEPAAQTADVTSSKQAIAPAPTSTTPPQPAKQGILDRFAEQMAVSVPMLIGGLLAIVALLLGIVIAFKSRSRESYNATVFEPEPQPVFGEEPQRGFGEEPQPAIHEGPDEQAERETGEPDTLETSSPEVTQPDAIDEAAQQEVVRDKEPKADESQLTGLGLQTADTEDLDLPEDPVSEADIYMAYGRHQQAVEMLQRAIDADPDRADLRVKLLEVYQEQGTLAENAETVAKHRDQIVSLDARLAPEIDALLQPEGEETVSGAADDLADDIGEDIAPGDLGLDLDLDELALDGADDETVEQAAAEPRPASVADEKPLAEEVDTKLDLARAYFDMGDYDGAREILQEVIEEGAGKQQEQAREMLAKLA